jgi:hypothetical protein
MKIARSALSTLSLAMLLTFVGGTAFASPGQQAWRDELRAMHQQQPWRDQGQAQPARDDRVDSQGSSNGTPNPPQHANGEPPKKTGKMSAEERRALRRQINEAGRDIYAPGR